MGNQCRPGFPSLSLEQLLRPHGDSGGAFPGGRCRLLWGRERSWDLGLPSVLSVGSVTLAWAAGEFSLFVSASPRGQSHLRLGACCLTVASGLLNCTHVFVCGSVPESRRARFGSGVMNPACTAAASDRPPSFGLFPWAKQVYFAFVWDTLLERERVVRLVLDL